jgi:hypothetical protein
MNKSFLTISQGTQLQYREFESFKIALVSIMVKCFLDHVVAINCGRLSKESVKPHQMCHMLHTPAVISVIIPDPALIKRKMSLA